MTVLVSTWLSIPAIAEPPAAVGERFEFTSSARGRPEQVWGYLSVPAGVRGSSPLMLILHSSGGLHPRDWSFARTVNAMGVASLVIDSFGPRGLARVSENKLSFGEREEAIDVLSALAALRRDERLDLGRVAAMGRSNGGQTAIRLSLQAARDQLPLKGPPLGLALAITPGCTSQQADRTVTPGTEVWLFLADHDMSPYTRCISYAEKMTAAGGNVHFKVYANSFHTFDGSDQPVWHPKEEVYANCANDRIRPGYSIRVDTGEPLRSQADWNRFFAACVTHGAWVGGNPEATRQLDQDWTAVVRRWLQGR
jgi:dienelactone hydrolase